MLFPHLSRLVLSSPNFLFQSERQEAPELFEVLILKATFFSMP